MSNEMNVRECFESTESSRASYLSSPRINSTNAFNRLMAVRSARKELMDKINANVESLPQHTRDMYDDLIYLMKKIEIEEGQLVALGD